MFKWKGVTGEPEGFLLFDGSEIQQTHQLREVVVETPSIYKE